MLHRPVLLEPGKHLDAMLGGKTAKDTIPMLCDALEQVDRHANVERAIRPRRHEIDNGIDVARHGAVANGFPLPQK